MPLATLADVEAWLNLPSGNADEQVLLRLLSSASAFVERICSRKFDSRTLAEIRDGNGLDRMTPREHPVVSVAAVKIENSTIPASSGYGTPGFLLAERSVVLFGYRFTRGTANVVLTYVAGWQTVPDDVQQAVIELVAMRYRERDRIGISSAVAGGETTSYSLRDMPAQVASLLQQYRAVVPK